MNKKTILLLYFIAWITAIHAQNPRINQLGDRRTELYSYKNGKDSVRFTISGKADTVKVEWFAYNDARKVIWSKDSLIPFKENLIQYDSLGKDIMIGHGAKKQDAYSVYKSFSQPKTKYIQPSNYFRDNRLYIGYVNNGWSGLELGVFTGGGHDGSNDGNSMVPSIAGGIINLGAEYYPRPQLFSPKLGVHFIVILGEIGIETAYNTQFKGDYLWSLKPKVGVTLLGCYTLSYNYSFYKKEVDNPVFALMNHHGLSFIIRSQKKDDALFFRIF